MSQSYGGYNNQDDGRREDERYRTRYVRLKPGNLIFCIIMVAAFTRMPEVNPLFSTGYNSYFSQPVIKAISSVTGKVPLSIAELLLFVLIITFIFRTFKMIAGIFRGDFNPLKSFLNFFMGPLSFIIAASILIWGFNYRMPGISIRLGLKNERADINALVKTTEYLMKEAEEERKELASDNLVRDFNTKDDKKAEESVYEAFSKLSAINSNFSGNLKPLKPLYSGNFISYSGIEGFFFPVTGEANYNPYSHPIIKFNTMFHETAHAYGFAKEDETGAVAYIASRLSPDIRTKYSVTVISLIHAMDELKLKSSSEWEKLSGNLNGIIKEDLKSYSAYIKPKNKKAEDLFNEINDMYLKSAGDKNGISSYSKTTGYIYSYLKSTKKIN